MFSVDIRFQLAAAVFLIILIVKYISGRRLPILPARVFTALLFTCCLNLIFDISTVYTVTHLDSVSPLLNEILHRGFFIVLDTLGLLDYIYVLSLGHRKKLFSAKTIPFFLPYVLSIVYTCFGEIYYHVEPQHAYSYGPPVFVIFGCVAFYMLMAIITAIITPLSNEKRRAVIIGACFWICTTIFQAVFPTIFVSGIASVALVFFIYLSLENPREFHDTDAGCFNDHAFHVMAEEFYRRNKEFQVMGVVITNFEYIMSKNGHSAGYTLIRKLARYIEATTSCHVYHIRGNTLAIMVKGDLNSVYPFAQRISERLINEWECEMGGILLEGVIDIISCPKFAENTDELYDLIGFMASDNIKADSGICTANEEIISRRKKVAAVTDIIRRAIAEDGFNVVYQPIYSVKEQKFCSAEALVRLKDTETVGYISPDIFIPIAEKSGLIGKVGEIVFEKVCRCIKSNALVKHGIKYIEVNLSGLQCSDPGLPSDLGSILEKTGVNPKLINLEITETAAIESGTALGKNMRALRKMGCSFSMDDFGTGYSNLSKIAEINYDLIKLDKSLVTPCMKRGGKNSYVILKSVAEMISRLGIKMVAEGVETSEELNMLENLGIDYIQGYYFSRPLNEEDFVRFIHEHE